MNPLPRPPDVKGVSGKGQGIGEGVRKKENDKVMFTLKGSQNWKGKVHAGMQMPNLKPLWHMSARGVFIDNYYPDCCLVKLCRYCDPSVLHPSRLSAIVCYWVVRAVPLGDD